MHTKKGAVPGDDGPWGRWGTDQQESVAGLSGHSLLTLFPLVREARRGTAASLRPERPARREESCSGAAISGVRRGAIVPRRTEPKRVSAASAERTGFDRFDY